MAVLALKLSWLPLRMSGISFPLTGRAPALRLCRTATIYNRPSRPLAQPGRCVSGRSRKSSGPTQTCLDGDDHDDQDACPDAEDADDVHRAVVDRGAQEEVHQRQQVEDAPVPAVQDRADLLSALEKVDGAAQDELQAHQREHRDAQRRVARRPKRVEVC